MPHAPDSKEIVRSLRPAPVAPARLRRVQGMSFPPMPCQAKSAVGSSAATHLPLAPQTQGTRFPPVFLLHTLSTNPHPTSARKPSLVTRAPVAAVNQSVRMAL